MHIRRGADACMSQDYMIHAALETNLSSGGSQISDKPPVNVHHSQHFLDRVTKVMIQAEAWRTNGSVAISGRASTLTLVEDMWHALLKQQGGNQQVHRASCL